MDSYQDWQQYKLYQSHLQRLKQITHKTVLYKPQRIIKQKSSTNQIKQSMHSTAKKQIQNELTPRQEKKISRYKTEPYLKKTQMLRTPIPLVSQRQGNLIRSALNSKSMSLKDKQQILENYLLSKRILETKSVIKPSQIKREFRMHKKISQNMSKSRKALSYSKKRSQSFRQFEKQKDEEISNKTVGQGRNYFEFRIRQILLIKGIIVKNPSVLYNLKILVGKNRFQIRAIDYNSFFNENIKIKFKKSMMANNPQITILLSMMRQNHQIQIGSFKPNIGNFKSKTNQVYKITKDKFPVGTIDIEGKTTYFLNIIN